MLVSTVGDELKSASRAAGGQPALPEVFGLSLKDRSAVLPAGHMADAAFCLDTKTGAVRDEHYYRADLPAWAAAFNAKKPADAFAGKTWTYLDPAGERRHPASRGRHFVQRGVRQSVSATTCF
jgi:hypothetical protein